MASFLQDLWTSVLTPGPTASLLIATNASFACLQFLLLCLLLATYNIHLLVLSCLCAALWWSINWFAAELRSGEPALPSQAARQQKDYSETPATQTGDSETETESVEETMKPPPRPVPSTRLQPGSSQMDAAVRKRRSVGDSSGYISTDSEWDKISENSGRDR